MNHLIEYSENTQVPSKVIISYKGLAVNDLHAVCFVLDFAQKNIGNILVYKSDVY